MIPLQKINYVEIMMAIYNKLAFSTTRKYLLQETQSQINKLFPKSVKQFQPYCVVCCWE